MIIIITILLVLIAIWMLSTSSHNDYSPSPSPEAKPQYETCYKCGHAFSPNSGKQVYRMGWFCREHVPKYDAIGDNFDDEDVYYRNHVKCDENGVIKKEAINPK